MIESFAYRGQQALSYFRLRLIIHMRRIFVLEMPSYQLREGFGGLVACGPRRLSPQKNPGLSINLIEGVALCPTTTTS